MKSPFLNEDNFFKSNEMTDEGLLLKARKMPVGTISHGMKKVAEGKWIPTKSLNKERK